MRSPPSKAPVRSGKAIQSAAKKSLSAEKSTGLVTSARASQEQAKIIEVPTDEDGITVVDSAGDVVLSFRANDGDDDACCFRVASTRLRSRSKYFERLLGNSRFLEGATVANAASIDDHSEDSPASSLPRVEVVEVGRISPVKSIRPLVTDLLVLLHHGQLVSKKTPLVNLANLAIAADRFDAGDTVAEFLRTSNAILRPKAVKSPLDEPSLRQRLLIGLLVKDEEFVSVYSKDLILRGSSMWAAEGADPPNDALWWDLPRNIEEELQIRRRCILDTIWTLVNARIAAYTSRSRQCRLGYDTSPQCDSFHLGEFVRFLSRAGLLQFSSSLAFKKPSDHSKRDILDIISTLRSCPSYQLDANHSHCGPRKQLLAGLRFIESCLSEQGVGICLDCWNDRSNIRRSWSEGKAALSFDTARASKEWNRRRGIVRGHSAHGSPTDEYTARALFTADDKIWNLEAGTLGASVEDGSQLQLLLPASDIK